MTVPWPGKLDEAGAANNRPQIPAVLFSWRDHQGMLMGRCGIASWGHPAGMQQLPGPALILECKGKKMCQRCDPGGDKGEGHAAASPSCPPLQWAQVRLPAQQLPQAAPAAASLCPVPALCTQETASPESRPQTSIPPWPVWHWCELCLGWGRGALSRGGFGWLVWFRMLFLGVSGGNH